MPSEPPKVRIFSMDDKVSREKLNKLLEELAHITCKDGEPIKNLKDSDKERALELFEKIEDILRKSPEVQSSEDKRIIIPQSILIYIARASLYMHAQTYFHIVQSVTNTFLGRVDLELNNYYQMIVDGINHLLTLDECKDFPGEFKPFNENIFPETGILKIGWKGFAPDCADFLSKAQKYFHDTPEPPENVITSPIYFKYLSQKHSAIIEKAHEYASKVKRLCDEHNKKETTPSKATTGAKGRKGRPREYTDDKLNSMQKVHDDYYTEKQDSKYAWNKVAEIFNVKSGDAARIACMTHQKKLKCSK